MPMAISIEPTTACNLGCPECPSGLKQFSRPTGNLRTEVNKQIIDELHKKLIYANYYFQGEPFINRSIYDQISYANSKGIYTSTSTNGHFLTEENCKKIIDSGLKRLIISIDGTTQDVYEQYRIDGELSKVIQGAKNMVAAKKSSNSIFPTVVFQFLVVAPNEHQIDEVQQLGDQIGVDEIAYKTAQVYDFKNGNPLIPQNEKYARYVRKSDGTYKLKNKMFNHCWRMWSSCVITWDAKIVPCCFDKDAKYTLGDLSKTSFREIWKSTEYVNFRRKVNSDRQSIDICNNCSEGSKVWA